MLTKSPLKYEGFGPRWSLRQTPQKTNIRITLLQARLTRDACRFARYGGLEPLRRLPVHKIDNLYFYNITQHGGRKPDVVVDISDVVAEWEQVMNCHESQVRSKSYIELQKAAARLLGLTIDTEYAAGVYTNDPLRLETLSDIRLSSRNF
jgi:LmbE family N-acetylglucosaminyl deacetylase